MQLPISNSHDQPEYLAQLFPNLPSLIISLFITFTVVGIAIYAVFPKTATKALPIIVSVFPFIAGLITASHQLSIMVSLVQQDALMFGWLTFFSFMLGYARGFRSDTMVLTVFASATILLFYSGLLLVIDWLPNITFIGTYHVFVLTYSVLSIMDDQHWLTIWLAAAPTLGFVQRLIPAGASQQELALKVHLIASINQLYWFPSVSGWFILLLMLQLLYHTTVAYHLVKQVKVTFRMFALVELFFYANQASQLIRKTVTPTIASIVCYTLIALVFLTIQLMFGSVAYAMGSGPIGEGTSFSSLAQNVRTGVMTGLQRFLASQLTEEQIARLTQEQLEMLARHFWSNRQLYAAGGAGYGAGWQARIQYEEFQQWFNTNREHVDSVLGNQGNQGNQ